MTESEGVLLDRVQLERAFTALGERLVQRGVVADVFVVGSAAYVHDKTLVRCNGATPVLLFPVSRS